MFVDGGYRDVEDGAAVFGLIIVARISPAQHRPARRLEMIRTRQDDSSRENVRNANRFTTRSRAGNHARSRPCDIELRRARHVDGSGCGFAVVIGWLDRQEREARGDAIRARGAIIGSLTKAHDAFYHDSIYLLRRAANRRWIASACAVVKYSSNPDRRFHTPRMIPPSE